MGVFSNFLQSILSGLSSLSSVLSKESLDYFLSPKETGYDLPKTALYAVLLVVAVYTIYRALKKLKIKIDERLAVAIAPYVAFGGCLRVIKDAGLVDSYLFVTPGIYVFVFSIVFSVLLLSILLQKKFKIEYYKTMFLIGVLLLPFVLAQLDFANLNAVPIVALFLAPWAAMLIFVKWSAANKIVSALHMFDANTTFTAVSFFGYYEQHILPTFFINSLGPASFIILKFAAVVISLYLIDKFSDKFSSNKFSSRLLINKDFGLYIKIVIGVLGAATGTRDFISLAAGI